MRRFPSIAALALTSCTGMIAELPDSGGDQPHGDSGIFDAGDVDSGAPDSGVPDAGAPDAGEIVDSGAPDAGASVDAGSRPIFIIGGQDQRYLVSADARTWQHDNYVEANGFDNAYGSIAVGNGCVLMTGDPGIMRSTDGVTFTSQLGPTTGTSFHGSVVRFNGSVFVVVGQGDAWRSGDGISWEHATSTGYAPHWQGLAYGNGRWVAIGDGHTKVSEDGLAWHDFTMTADPDPAEGLAFGNGLFVAVGRKSFLGRVLTSADGVTWAELPLITTKYQTGFASIVFGKGKFLTNDCCNMFESLDAGEWTMRGAGANAQLAFGAGTVIGINWRTNAFVYDDDAGALVGTFSGDLPNQYNDAGLWPWFTGVGAGVF